MWAYLCVSISGYIYFYIMHDINEKYIHKIWYMKFHIRGSFKKLIKKEFEWVMLSQKIVMIRV